MLLAVIGSTALATTGPAAAVAESDLSISSVSIDTAVTETYPELGGDIRLPIRCAVDVAFEDDSPPEAGADGYYELAMEGMEWGIGSASPSLDVPTTISTWGCWPFTDGETATLSVRYFEFDESVGKYGDYVLQSESAPFDWIFHEVQHPAEARMEGPGVSPGQLKAGQRVDVVFDGSWDPDATVAAKVTATRGWTTLSSQDANERELSTSFDPETGTFSFTPPEDLAGRTVYVSVKASLGDGSAADYSYIWSPGLIVDPNPKKTPKKWVKTFGKKDTAYSTMWLTTTRAKATKRGARKGLRFVYQGWWGSDEHHSWHSSTRASVANGSFGGCPLVAQRVKVLAFVPGRKAVSKTFKLSPPNCRPTIARGDFGSAVGLGAWG